jgi:hypothetical protein
MRKLIILFGISFLAGSISAQETNEQRQEERQAHINELSKEEEEGVITYKKSFDFGLKLLNDGYGFYFDLGRAKNVKIATLYQLEISERKAIKEEKETSPFINSNPFIFGKENFIYPVRLGVQQQRLLGNKANKNGVNITANYGGGISLSVIRPYYVQVIKNNELVYVKYDSADSSYFLSGQIISGPTFGKGWNDLSVTPGLYAKTAVRFDYGRFNQIISAIEIGACADYYTKEVPILIQNPAKQFFFSGYVSVLFGKRK